MKRLRAPLERQDPSSYAPPPAAPPRPSSPLFSGRGSWGVRVAALAACAVLLGGSGDVGAQKPPGSNTGTPLETEALSLYHENNLITARSKAQEVLDADADSVIGNYVMACVLREAEGILPRAMYHMGHARKVFEERYGSPPRAEAPWHFHRELIFAAANLAGEMEEYSYQLDLLDYHDALYDPDLTSEHAWALLHLGQLDKAREAARRGIASTDAWQQSLGKNALCAIEGEARTRKPYYEACLAALNHAKQKAVNDPKDAGGVATDDPTKNTALAVHYYNASLAAYSVLKFDDVERLAKEGGRRSEFTIANPWRLMVRFYTDSARVAEAVPAVREMQRWRVRQPASLRDQDRAETDVALATLLMIAGEAETGLRLVSRAVERPDRRGLVSSKPEQALGASALLRRALQRQQAELNRERASMSGTVKRVGANLEAVGDRVAAWPDDERIAAVLTDEKILSSTFRMYIGGGITPVPAWLLGDLIQVIGAGVVSVAVAEAREDEAATPDLLPYFDALDAEVALARVDEQRAVKLAKQALDKLPQAEALLQARVAAVGAEAAYRSGDPTTALSLFERAMQRDPGVIRRLGFSLPATIKALHEDPAVSRARALLERSPRLDEASWGFSISVERAGERLKACLRSPQGAVLGCSEVARAPKENPDPKAPKEPEDDDNFAARLVEAFHKNTFAMRVGLTSTDLNSLDGSTTLAGQAQREMMQNVLTEAAKDDLSPLVP